MELLLVAVTMVAIFIVLITVVLTLNVLKLSSPETLLEAIPDGLEILANNTEFLKRHRWAAEIGFVPDLLADYRGMGGQRLLISVWRHPTRGTYFCSYETPEKTVCEFVTCCERDIALTTTNNRDGLLFPTPPDRYVEAFERLGVDELLRRHEESLFWIGQYRSAAPIRPDLPTATLIIESIQSQTRYVRSLPLWPLRASWWYLGRRYLLNGKSIAERYRD